MDTAFWTVIASYLTIALTIAAFVIQSIRRGHQAVHDARRIAVENLLSPMEDAVRIYRRPSVFRPWYRPDYDFALAVPRLVLNLERTDQAGGMRPLSWFAEQVLLAPGTGVRINARRAGTARYWRRARDQFLQWTVLLAPGALAVVWGRKKNCARRRR